ncbi:MAG: polymer-forming cytoskeletal protein [Anaerolineae bacterium]|nr:polymer-forming cytoskeletal protein [Anaerolineae bacterium]
MRYFTFLKRAAWVFIASIVASLALFVGRVEATDGLRGDECVVAAEEIIIEDFYFFCNTLVVHGLVDGDLIGVASEVTISQVGRVTGNVWVAGGQLTIEGIVEDDVHFAGADLDIIGLARFPNPETDVIALGLSLETASDVVIPGDVIFYGYQATLNSRINGDVDFQGQALHINAAIGGNVHAVVGDPEGSAPLDSFPVLYSITFSDPGLRFTTEGYVNGNLHYRAPQRTSIARNVGGTVFFTQSLDQTSLTQVEESETFLQLLGNYILETTRDVAALSMVGVLVLNFFAKLILEPGYRVQTRIISAFSWGLVLFLASIPVGLTLLLGSLVVLGVVAIVTLNELTLLVSIVLVVANLGFVGGFIFLVAFLGRAVSCFVVGYVVVRWAQQTWLRYGQQPPPRLLGELWFTVIIGVTLVSLLVNLPLGALVGRAQFLLTGFVALTGVGAIFMYLRDLYYISDRRGLLLGRGRAIPPPPD